MDGGRIVNAYRFVRFDNLAASLGFLPLQGIAQQSFAGRAGPGKSPKILVTARSAPAYLQLANIWMIPAGDPACLWRLWYLRLILQGIARGYEDGCAAGISSPSQFPDGPQKQEVFKKCWSHFPLSGQDSVRLVDSITAFYIDYPDERFVHADQVLFKLHAGFSVKQVHEQFQKNGYGKSP